MKTQTVVLIVVAVLVVAGLVAVLTSRPKIEETPGPAVERAQAADPLSAPLLVHMRDDEGIDIGPDASHALAVSREGDRVRVVVSDRLIEKLGADLLPRLGMVEREETMAWERYERFLKDLHDAVVAVEGHEHGHEGEEPEAEHGEHEAHDHDEVSSPGAPSSEKP